MILMCYLLISLQNCSTMTPLCEKVISVLPSWRKQNGPNQLLSFQQFVFDVQEQLNPLATEDDVRNLAQQLHSMGEASNPPHALETIHTEQNLNLLFMQVVEMNCFFVSTCKIMLFL